MKKKVLILVHELSANPIVRTYPIAQYLEALNFEVTLAGFITRGNEIYTPYQNIDFKIISYEVSPGIIDFCRKSKLILEECKNFDIIYCCKPLVTTFAIGLISKYLNNSQKLYLDIEDYELIYHEDFSKSKIQRFITRYFRGFNKPNHIRNLKILHLFVKKVDGITVSSDFLQSIYGGIKLYHGPDERIFNPNSKINKEELKKKLGIPAGRPIILFAGFPYKHKGLEEIIYVIKKSTYTPFLITAGPDNQSIYSKINNSLNPSHYKYLGLIDNLQMPEILAISDIIPVLQKESIYTKAQLPAKLIEAMCMGKIIVATNVGDLPKILSDGCGIVLPSKFNKDTLLQTFEDIFKNLEYNREVIGDLARKKYMNEFSKNSNVQRLKSIL